MNGCFFFPLSYALEKSSPLLTPLGLYPRFMATAEAAWDHQMAPQIFSLTEWFSRKKHAFPRSGETLGATPPSPRLLNPIPPHLFRVSVDGGIKLFTSQMPWRPFFFPDSVSFLFRIVKSAKNPAYSQSFSTFF